MLSRLVSRRIRYLRYAETETSGSIESFHHYLWAYLLPALDYVLRRSPVERFATRYAIRSCGPLMDPVATVLLDHFGVKYGLTHPDHPGFDDQGAIEIQRWDGLLERPFDTETDNPRELRKNLWPRFSAMRSRLIKAAKASTTTAYDGKLLLIRRADEPGYYKRGGKQAAHYGAGRRALTGLEETAADLEAAGIPTEIFDCGTHGIFEQIRAFHDCCGVVAIRGAELAHLAWMRPGTQAVMVTIPHMREPLAVHRRFCAINDVRLDVLPILDQENAPRITAALLLPLLKRED